MIILEHNYAHRNPWMQISPTCVNGCPSGFVIATKLNPDQRWAWRCNVCEIDFVVPYLFVDGKRVHETDFRYSY